MTRYKGEAKRKWKDATKQVNKENNAVGERIVLTRTRENRKQKAQNELHEDEVLPLSRGLWGWFRRKTALLRVCSVWRWLKSHLERTDLQRPEWKKPSRLQIIFSLRSLFSSAGNDGWQKHTALTTTFPSIRFQRNRGSPTNMRGSQATDLKNNVF